MVTDDSSGGPAGNSEVASLLHELTEALTALGSYVAAAHRKVADRSEPIREEIDELLGKGLVQYERATTAVHLLAVLYRREQGGDTEISGEQDTARNDVR